MNQINSVAVLPIDVLNSGNIQYPPCNNLSVHQGITGLMTVFRPTEP